MKYRITCLECKESDVIEVDEVSHVVTDYAGKLGTNFQSFRWRPDMKWGFLCKCSNDNRLAPSEADDFDKLVKGDPISIKKIASSLLIPDDEQFRTEAI